mmetsp:Transcript_29492/g.53542  ORF Transcript_29492/g.53542 Transcript_29492/m.53542 type:complete len:83 (+) Transcript_29492:98-346(+)
MRASSLRRPQIEVLLHELHGERSIPGRRDGEILLCKCYGMPCDSYGLVGVRHDLVLKDGEVQSGSKPDWVKRIKLLASLHAI